MVCSFVQATGQWVHDFTNDDLTSWSGDIDAYRVNEEGRLQLNASEAGQTYIYRESLIDFDTVVLAIYHRMDFSPSSNNKSRIYLALDDSDPMLARGYFIEIGENGSNDALNFYYTENGIESFIASASMGSMATEPSMVRLQIDVYPDGLWSIRTNYNGEEFTNLELEFVDDQFSFKESRFFGLYSKFSASRADKFFYDDLSLLPFVPDVLPPQVVMAVAAGSREVEVEFSEPVLVSDATQLMNYTLDNGLGNPNTITEIGSPGNRFRLTFDQDFDASVNYNLSISGIEDLHENEMVTQSVSFLFAASPIIGDLYLSEILFDPYPMGEDFVEIYNASDNNLELKGTIIRNAQKEEERSINKSIIMAPKSYLAMTEEVDFLYQEYKPEAEAVIAHQEIPAFNNDQGNVMLVNALGGVLDSFDYHADQHFQLIDDTEGVSLERVRFEIASSDRRNWQSASKRTRYATPGYENSNSLPNIEGDGNFVLTSESFSPNQDGDEDQMVLSYTLDKPGYLANISVYDAAGFKIKELSNNELLGRKGLITWDGVGDDNLIADIGIYIILGEVFHPDGDVMQFKLTTVLADFID